MPGMGRMVVVPTSVRTLELFKRISKERLSGIALAKPEKRSPGQEDAVYGWALTYRL